MQIVENLNSELEKKFLAGECDHQELKHHLLTAIDIAHEEKRTLPAMFYAERFANLFDQEMTKAQVLSFLLDIFEEENEQWQNL